VQAITDRNGQGSNGRHCSQRSLRLGRYCRTRLTRPYSPTLHQRDNRWEQFAVFVLVKNPFARPVWIERVHVSLPSELLLADDGTRKKELVEQEKKEAERRTEEKAERESIRRSIEDLQERLVAFRACPDPGMNAQELGVGIRSLERALAKFPTSSASVVIQDVSSLGDVRVESASPNVFIKGKEAERSSMGAVEILDPHTVLRSMARERRVTLQSSLPSGASLQPSSTAVYTVLLNVKRSFIFPPSNYFLQFSVNFSFERPHSDNADRQETLETLMTNTVSHEIAIRPSVYSLIGGAAIGGISGAIARVLKASGQFDLSSLTWSAGVSGAFAVVLAVILSAVSIIFVARKSEAQSFISVEDFWGGLLIGFFVGYTGTEFFADLTRSATPR
jgi:hypothetical protein